MCNDGVVAATDLYGLCAEWLAVCEDAVASAPGGSIANAFVSPGSPAFDCELLAVHAGGPAEGDTLPLTPPLAPGHRTDVQGAVWMISLVATVVRCGATPDNAGNIDLSDLDATARVIDGDAWAILNFTRSRKKDGSLFAPSSREMIFDQAIPVVPEGGLYGWQIQMRVALGGYRA